MVTDSKNGGECILMEVAVNCANGCGGEVEEKEMVVSVVALMWCWWW